VSAPSFFVDTVAPGRVSLSAEDSRHALRSLRLRHGEAVTVADGRGAVALGVLAGELDDRALVEVQDVRRVERRGPEVSVALAPPKGDRLGWAVQKLAELGVDEVNLIQTERSARSWPPDRLAGAVARLRAVAREAAMQARSPFLTDVRGGRSMDDVLTEENAHPVMLWEAATEPLAALLPEGATRISVLVGPEGGFTQEEADQARRAGAGLASLGSNVLRTETAAIVGAGLVLARYGRLG
jgi:16S rRNA (uracil1498-N3)-methyltransferase